MKGFAVGRTIFGQPSRRWLQGEIDDAALIEQVKQKYLTLIGSGASTVHRRAARTDSERVHVPLRPFRRFKGIFLPISVKSRNVRSNKSLLRK